MNSAELRKAFLDFFISKNHQLVESASLVPGNDPTLLFTNAGMVQFKDALALREDRGYTRAVSCQRCVRAGGKHNDLDNVGYTARHHTFFEMLGNFSFGDYFKKEAIAYAWEFLTEVLKLPEDRLWVTVHQDDDEAAEIWIKDIGFNPDRITRLGDDDNFWTMGDTGPCGPSSEIFYDHGEDVPGGPPGTEDGELDRYVEIWNLVFTQFDRSADGTLTPLPKPCVDTGLGFERLAAILQGVHNNYDIDLFQSLIKHAADLLSNKDLEDPGLRVISDHVRAATFLIADGVIPSNEGRGYVLRRIIRRALRHGHKMQSEGPFFHKLVATVVAGMGEAYPLIVKTEKQISRLLLKEEEQFELTLDQGMRILGDAIRENPGKEISGEVVFKLYDTYGFPVDLTADIAREKHLSIDMDGFDHEMDAQKQRARDASKFGLAAEDDLGIEIETHFTGYEHLSGSTSIGVMLRQNEKVSHLDEGEEGIVVVESTPFYAQSGGQVGDKGILAGKDSLFEVRDTRKSADCFLHYGVMKKGIFNEGDEISTQVDIQSRNTTRLNHSATHLLHAALKEVLGDHVNQRGSLVNSQRLRFDFSHFEAVTSEELKRIERGVNAQIRMNSEIKTEVMDLEDAKKKGAMALFDEKYSQKVRVLTMGDGFSVELCGGTHAGRTGDIGLLKIISEQGIASGVRRIEAVTGDAAMDYVEVLETNMTQSSALLKTESQEVPNKIRGLLEQNKELSRKISSLNMKLASGSGRDVEDEFKEIKGIKYLVREVEGASAKTLPDVLDQMKTRIKSGVVILAAVSDEKVALIAGVTPDLTDKLNAGDLVNHVAVQVGGRGGGRADMARAGGTDTAALGQALDSVHEYLSKQL